MFSGARTDDDCGRSKFFTKTIDDHKFIDLFFREGGDQRFKQADINHFETCRGIISFKS